MADCFDFVIIGSGFGGSVSAMRLTEKGYSVLVLEKGKRFEEKDFAKSNWQFWKYLWLPALRAYGILQIGILKGVMVLHGAGVGGGSLGYANVLEIPTDKTFATPSWNQNTRWGEVLRPHYETAKRMLGVARNPKLWKADHILKQMADEIYMGPTFRATEVGAYFGEAGVTVSDPYFGGEGPARAGCKHCGGCMVGCRYNAKNTLPKNYLYFAEKNGAEIKAEVEVTDVRPSSMVANARYEVIYQSSTSLFKHRQMVYARNVIFSAGVMGTVKLLLNLRDVKKSLPQLSGRLGHMVRTNSEALLGSLARTSEINYSEGVAISSIYNQDEITRVEPVRYPDGSSLMRFLAAPLIDTDVGVPVRLLKFLGWALTHPVDFAKALILSGWAHNVTILLVMQHADNRMRFRIGRSGFTLFRRAMVAEEEPGYEIHAQVKGSHELTREFAKRTNGVALGSLGENLMGLPTTAHILGGAPIGKDASEGVVNESLEVHNYEGLYIIDGSIMPANPGVNPSLTITALAEYAMSKIQEKPATDYTDRHGLVLNLGEMMTELLYKELTFAVIGAAMEVHRILGPGFLEAIYQVALERELTLRGIPFGKQVKLPVSYKGEVVGEYIADFIIDGKLIVEIKAVSNFNSQHQAQAMHHLAATGCRLTLLPNFGKGSLEHRRVIK